MKLIKRGLIIAFVTLLGVSSIALVGTWGERGYGVHRGQDLVPVSERIDLGPVSTLTGYDFAIEISNHSSERWTVERVSSNCGCVFEHPCERTLEPRQSLSIPMRMQVPANPGASHIAVDVLLECSSESGLRKNLVVAVVARTHPVLRVLPGQILIGRGHQREVYLFGPEALVSVIPAVVEIQELPATLQLNRLGTADRIISKPVKLSIRKDVRASADIQRSEIIFSEGREVLLRVPLELK